MSKTYDEWTTAQETTGVSTDSHDLTVAYYDEGTGDPVVFLHGIPTNSYLWQEVVPAIAEERRVIVPDMVGYGQSSMYDGFDRSIRVQELVIEEVVDERHRTRRRTRGRRHGDGAPRLGARDAGRKLVAEGERVGADYRD